MGYTCNKCGSELKEQLYGTEMSSIYSCPKCDGLDLD